MVMIMKVLFPFICGLAWMWRGWSFPKAIHGYYRSLLTSFVIIGAYCLCLPTMSMFSVRGLLAVLCLGLLEGLLGYGKTCEEIDYVYRDGEVDYIHIEDGAKEPLNYLGFISMAYYLFPYMILQPNRPTWVYIVIAVLGFRIYPLAKLAQIKSYNTICWSKKLTVPIIKKEIKLPIWLCDAWKWVEFNLGMGFAVWLSGVIS